MNGVVYPIRERAAQGFAGRRSLGFLELRPKRTPVGAPIRQRSSRFLRGILRKRSALLRNDGGGGRVYFLPFNSSLR